MVKKNHIKITFFNKKKIGNFWNKLIKKGINIVMYFGMSVVKIFINILYYSEKW